MVHIVCLSFFDLRHPQKTLHIQGSDSLLSQTLKLTKICGGRSFQVAQTFRVLVHTHDSQSIKAIQQVIYATASSPADFISVLSQVL